MQVKAFVEAEVSDEKVMEGAMELYGVVTGIGTEGALTWDGRMHPTWAGIGESERAKWLRLARHVARLVCSASEAVGNACLNEGKKRGRIEARLSTLEDVALSCLNGLLAADTEGGWTAKKVVVEAFETADAFMAVMDERQEAEEPASQESAPE